MTQHFLLSAEARTLSLKSIYRMGEDNAYETFRRVRWHDTDGEPVCPRCGCIRLKKRGRIMQRSKKWYPKKEPEENI